MDYLGNKQTLNKAKQMKAARLNWRLLLINIFVIHVGQIG